MNNRQALRITANRLIYIYIYIYEALVYPFTRKTSLFCVLFILDILGACCANIIADENTAVLKAKVFSLIILFSRGIVFAWSAIFISELLSYIRRFGKILSRCWIIIVVSVLSVSALIDICLLMVQGDFFSSSYCDIILQTNFNESKEFIATYVSPQVVMAIACTAAACAAIYRLHITLRVNRYMVLGLLITCCVLSIKYPSFYGKADIAGKIEILLAREPIVDMVMSSESVVPENDKEAGPQKVILIIGESGARSHYSVYDYRLNTAPKLTELKNDSLLFAFTSVESPGLTTLASFKYFIGTYSTRGGECGWNECPTIPEVARKAGYRTYWLSNQNPRGFYDTQISRIAKLADTTIFTTDNYNLEDISAYDEVLIPLADQFSSNKEKNFFIIHMMGSHFKYKNRYPKTFLPLDIEEYSQLPANQRENIMQYDTSVAYNDSIVSEILKLFEHQDAIAVYFSDHGEDVYESSPDYVGHARPNNPASEKAGKAIPFFVYVTPEFKKTHPDLTSRINRHTNTPFNTQDAIYTLMDIMNVKFESNGDVKKYSLFQDNN